MCLQSPGMTSQPPAPSALSESSWAGGWGVEWFAGGGMVTH